MSDIKPKFNTGDLVYINESLNKYVSKRYTKRLGIVASSDKGPCYQYSIYIKNHRVVYWFNGDDLELIKKVIIANYLRRIDYETILYITKRINTS